jgi:hypothetical protein
LAFFVVDGILAPVLGWQGKIKVDDGSSSQNGQLANFQNNSGEFNLPADSPWRADLAKYMSIITYNTDPANVSKPWIVNPYEATANEINETDKLYFKGEVGGGGAGGGGFEVPGY